MSEKVEIWKKIRSEQVADCKIFKVRRDYSTRENSNQEYAFYCLENPNWVNVLAITKDNQVVVIEQFRHGADDLTIEIPGGMVDDYEDASKAALRELVEETGFTSNKIISLGKSRPNPAIQDNWLFHFLAIDCEKTKEVEFDETESVVTKLIDFEEFVKMIADERITHSAVLSAYLKYQIYNEQHNK